MLFISVQLSCAPVVHILSWPPIPVAVVPVAVVPVAVVSISYGPIFSFQFFSTNRFF